MMKKSTKALLINIILISLFFVLPVFIFRQFQSSLINIDLIQKVVFIVIMVGSILLFNTNNKNRKKLQNLKLLWLVLEIFGMLGIVYSGFILYLIFSLQNIGF